MVNFYPTFDPLNSFGNILGKYPRKISKENVEKEFTAIFYAEILRQAFKDQNSILGSTNEGFFGRSPVSPDLFIEQMALKLAENGSFGKEDLFPSRIPGRY